MKLTKDQEIMIKKWNSHARVSYNRALAILQSQSKQKVKLDSKMELRNKITPEKVNEESKWILETPKDIRADAVFAARQHLTTGMKQIKNKTIKHFKVKYQKKKHPTWSISVPKTAIKMVKDQKTKKEVIGKIKIFPTYIKDPIQLSKTKEPIVIEHDCKIQFDGFDYYLVVPISQPIGSSPLDSKVERKFVVSCDPGERTFLTTYDEEGNVLSIGNDKRTELEKYYNQIDSLKQRLSKNTSKKRRRDKKKIRKIYKKIKSKMTDFHHKVAKFMCLNYENIAIPPFNVKNRILQLKNLSKISKRSMSSLSHCTFMERLKTKAQKYRCNVIDSINERYTTQCCGSCGYLNKNIGCAKEYKCPNCNHHHDRDVNAARNIMFKIYKEVSIDKIFKTQLEGATGLKSENLVVNC